MGAEVPLESTDGKANLALACCEWCGPGELLIHHLEKLEMHQMDPRPGIIGKTHTGTTGIFVILVNLG